MTENEIGTVIVGAAIEVHSTLGGSGLLESVYEEALCQELLDRGLTVERQKSVPIIYKGRNLKSDLRLDIIVENKVIVEVKATTQYNKLFESQVLTYMRLSGIRLGYVINFGAAIVKQGIHRVINGVL
jgi:GxxExxY protein